MDVDNRNKEPRKQLTVTKETTKIGREITMVPMANTTGNTIMEDTTKGDTVSVMEKGPTKGKIDNAGKDLAVDTTTIPTIMGIVMEGVMNAMKGDIATVKAMVEEGTMGGIEDIGTSGVASDGRVILWV